MHLKDERKKVDYPLPRFYNTLNMLSVKTCRLSLTITYSIYTYCLNI